ncbi:CHAT domain-containing protein [Luteolibacter arcticus]|uniref:CHAT domain-containing protein n=1 Tax=Luteolibacter arcticus TaxID=1581411 RepID=A0ABT3GNX7_9BACT|nr:CHAT domain-containing protein [Luteolibacter arcticus]MCW1925194.1 CHAT domain-containing protein [Luteolibacter arcticus]
MLTRWVILVAIAGRLLAGEADELAARGEFRKAADLYLETAEASMKGDRGMAAAASLMNAATCLKMSGDVSAAALHVERARPLLGKEPRREVLLEWWALKGSVLSLGKRPAGAIVPLTQALDLVDANSDPSLVVDIRNDLGIALSSGGAHEAALQQFAQAAEIARQQGGGAGLLKARQNHLVASFQLWQECVEAVRKIEEVDGWPGADAVRAAASLKVLEESLQASIGIIDGNAFGNLALHSRLTTAMAAHRCGKVATANQLYAGALSLAREAGNPQLEASALLGLAEQYVGDRRFAETLRLLDATRALEGELDEADVAKLEVLTAISRHAIEPGAQVTGDAIRRAVSSVENIRSDLARSQLVSDLGRGFREFAGRPYLLLADHLLRGPYGSAEAEGKALREARDAMESFRTWEVNDFYRDDCVNLALSKARDLDRIGDEEVAVVYVIPLEDRIELLIGHDRGLRRFTSPVAGEELHASARRFRYHLENDGAKSRLFQEAGWLYRQLIDPVVDLLRERGVRHLVFVPDGALGNVPLGALYDMRNKRFLLEEFSVSVAPNLSLLEPSEASAEVSPLFAGGLSEAVQGFPAIPGVTGELERVSDMYATRRVLMNGEFTSEAIRASLVDTPADIVHLASHGEFLGRAGGCFLLTHDGRITLDDLEVMIRPRKFVGTPVNLLCLSACRTAAGDDRAALGLAGASVKSGARSVLATLWYVEDQSAAEVMTGFHRYLRDHPKGRAKADALRHAQLEVLRRDRDVHPSRWAPFVLVGSWR